MLVHEWKKRVNTDWHIWLNTCISAVPKQKATPNLLRHFIKKEDMSMHGPITKQLSIIAKFRPSTWAKLFNSCMKYYFSPTLLQKTFKRKNRRLFKKRSRESCIP